MAAACVLAAGCGEPAEDGVRSSFRELQRAFAAADVDGLCAVTTNGAQRHVGQLAHGGSQGCARDMRQFVKMVKGNAPPSGAGNPRIASMEVDGDRAIARVASSGGPETRVPFAKEDGEWKVDALYGGVAGGEQKDKFP